MLPIKYFRMKINETGLNNSDWDGSVGKTENKLGPSKGKICQVMAGHFD
jgi:hypothetical protein